tara:strand:- start:371 stop:685 length:315 start_codon:yes stop_codon:yes gene_type:complete
MNRMEKNYIKLELGVATWEVDINNDAMNDILDMGVECYPEEVYEIAYEEGYEISEDKLKMMFDEPDNSKNMLYPLDCYRDLSYNDWLDYKKERDDYYKNLKKEN